MQTAPSTDRIEVRHIADGEFEVVRGGWVSTPTAAGLAPFCLHKGDGLSASYICKLREIGNAIEEAA